MLIAIALSAQLAAAGPAPAPDGAPKNGVEYSALGVSQDSVNFTVDFDAATALWSSTAGTGPNATPSVTRRALTAGQVANLRALAVDALAKSLETKACAKASQDWRRPQMPPTEGFVRLVVRVDGDSQEAPSETRCWTAKARALQAAAYQAATSAP